MDRLSAAATLEDDKRQNMICTQSAGLQPGFFFFFSFPSFSSTVNGDVGRVQHTIKQLSIALGTLYCCS